MNFSALANQSINMFGSDWLCQRSNAKFKAISNGIDSNMIRVPLTTDIQLADVLQENQTTEYFATDLQTDKAAKYVSVFAVTHYLQNTATSQLVPAHLGSHTPAGNTDVAGFHSSPAQYVFWIPATFSLSIGDFFTTAQGTALRVARVTHTDNNGLQVIMHA